jgi:hypothetical protein
MKVEINDKTDQNNLKYPLLMISQNGSIGYFGDATKGIYLHHYNDEKQNGFPIFINKSSTTNWKPFNGKITLSNQ